MWLALSVIFWKYLWLANLTYSFSWKVCYHMITWSYDNMICYLFSLPAMARETKVMWIGSFWQCYFRLLFFFHFAKYDAWKFTWLCCLVTYNAKNRQVCAWLALSVYFESIWYWSYSFSWKVCYYLFSSPVVVRAGQARSCHVSG